NNACRRETDKAREKWWEARCKELEEHDRKGRSDLMYYEVSRLTKAGRKPASKNVAIKDGNGELRKETDEIKKRWKEYIEELYSKISKATGRRLGSRKRMPS